MFNISHFKEVVKECEGCMFSSRRIVGGDDTIICNRHPYPEIKWWFNEKCEHYIKEGCDPSSSIFDHE